MKIIIKPKAKRLIYAPQFPSDMRYQSWHLPKFTQEFEKEFDEVKVLGLDYLIKEKHKVTYNYDMFSPITQAIEFETAQINDYIRLDIKENDVLYLADISFPGLFCNVLYHKRPPKMFAYCHASSINTHDYFEKESLQKFRIEGAHAAMFDKIFFGSRYSLDKTKWANGEVVALPDSPKTLIYNTHQERRNIDIVSVCRPNIQKVDSELESQVEKDFGKIHREKVETWYDYSKLLSRSKVLLISSKEDTFNYTILDAIRCGCTPLVPNKLCFPEILPKFHRYDNIDNLKQKLYFITNRGNEVIPQIKCQDKVDNFFENICKIMKG